LRTKGIVFLNPSSGVKHPPAEPTALESAMRDAGLEIVPVQKDLDVTQIIRDRISQGVNLVIAAGGDGTINHVIQAIVNTDVRLAVLPLGTYNHFARDLGIPLDWRSALEVALTGTTQQIDTARVNERFFVNNLSIGLYPGFVARREERGRDYPRWKARLYAFYVTLRKYPHVTIAVEAESHYAVIRTQVFMVSNNSYDLSRLGVQAPRSTMSEGRLSVYWLPHVPRTQLMKFAGRYLAGLVRQTPGFRSFRTTHLKVQSRHGHLEVGIDGEVSTLNTPLTITSVPQSLLVKVPR
jgi:YegS/Rv2252/BmrU family lipid kinase